MNLRSAALLIACGAAATLAHAHEGHGLPGASHWHAGDALPWLGLLAVAIGAALWLNRRK